MDDLLIDVYIYALSILCLLPSISLYRDLIPYWYSVSWFTGAGLLNKRSAPLLVLGKAITSRMDCALHSMAISRSKPIPHEIQSHGNVNWDAISYQEQYHHEVGLHIAGHARDDRKAPSPFHLTWQKNLTQAQSISKVTNLQYMSEDVLLHGCIVNSDRASSDLHPIQNKIVMLSANLLKILLNQD